MKTNDDKLLKNKVLATDQGMSIVEVLIFIVILTVVLVSLISITTSVIRQSRANYNKTYATHHAQQLAEWIRIQKDVLGWNDFYSRILSSPGITTVWCVNNEIQLTSVLDTLLDQNDTTNCNFQGIVNVSPSIFNRTVTFSQNAGARTSNDSVKATIRVEWNESGNQVNFVETSTVYAPL